MIEEQVETASIQAHYDRLSRLYKTFWGNHIHHGYWENTDSPAEAQVRLIERLSGLARVAPGARVLDVGCGLGGSSIWLAENLNGSVLGLTISPVQVEIASKLAARAGVGERVSFVVHDANRLEAVAPAGGFDLVWAIESTEHLQDKRAFIESAAECLRRGGTLAIGAWLVPDTFASALDERLARTVCQDMLCPSLASMNEYTRWMHAAGFGAIRTEDITRGVEQTWDHCMRIARRPEVRLLLGAFDGQTRRFVEAFDRMSEAYRTGAMAYGIFAGQLDCGAPATTTAG